jgi:hypothetical protein
MSLSLVLPVHEILWPVPRATHSRQSTRMTYINMSQVAMQSTIGLTRNVELVRLALP